MNTTPQSFAELINRFSVAGTVADAEPYGTGHINDTYCVRLDHRGTITRYILQRINHNVFEAPDKLMSNIVGVTSHIRDKLCQMGHPDIARAVLTVIPTREGLSYYRDDDGNWWRMYIFIEGAQTFDVVQNPEHAFASARAFGTFERLLADYTTPCLYETIPDFHHTPTRFARLENAIINDTCNRAAQVKTEIKFALQNKSMISVLTDRLEMGDLHERVTHNDTKIDNVMIDDVTGTGICVIDLDTVMPSLSLYDFGDCVRSTTCLAAEDEKNLDIVHMDIRLFEALVKGYLSVMSDMLLPREIELLAFSGMLITFENGLRFLTDYLQGDVYYKTHREDQNLDRTRTQFKLVQSMQQQEKEMEACVRQYAELPVSCAP